MKGVMSTFLICTSVNYQKRYSQNKGFFYVRPLQVKPLDELLPWFCDVLTGKNTLQFKLKTMCAHAGIEGNKMNHNLRATGASEHFHANVPEKMT